MIQNGRRRLDSCTLTSIVAENGDYNRRSRQQIVAVSGDYSRQIGDYKRKLRYFDFLLTCCTVELDRHVAQVATPSTTSDLM